MQLTQNVASSIRDGYGDNIGRDMIERRNMRKNRFSTSLYLYKRLLLGNDQLEWSKLQQENEIQFWSSLPLGTSRTYLDFQKGLKENSYSSAS